MGFWTYLPVGLHCKTQFDMIVMINAFCNKVRAARKMQFFCRHDLLYCYRYMFFSPSTSMTVMSPFLVKRTTCQKPSVYGGGGASSFTTPVIKGHIQYQWETCSGY